MAETNSEVIPAEPVLVLSCGHPGSEAQLVHQVQGQQTAWCLTCSARVGVESRG
jgi:hypothetical protein